MSDRRYVHYECATKAGWQGEEKTPSEWFTSTCSICGEPCSDKDARYVGWLMDFTMPGETETTWQPSSSGIDIKRYREAFEKMAAGSEV